MVRRYTFLGIVFLLIQACAAMAQDTPLYSCSTESNGTEFGVSSYDPNEPILQEAVNNCANAWNVATSPEQCEGIPATYSNNLYSICDFGNPGPVETCAMQSAGQESPAASSRFDAIARQMAADKCVAAGLNANDCAFDPTNPNANPNLACDGGAPTGLRYTCAVQSQGQEYSATSAFENLAPLEATGNCNNAGGNASDCLATQCDYGSPSTLRVTCYTESQGEEFNAGSLYPALAQAEVVADCQSGVGSDPNGECASTASASLCDNAPPALDPNGNPYPQGTTFSCTAVDSVSGASNTRTSLFQSLAQAEATEDCGNNSSAGVDPANNTCGDFTDPGYGTCTANVPRPVLPLQATITSVNGIYGLNHATEYWVSPGDMITLSADLVDPNNGNIAMGDYAEDFTWSADDSPSDECDVASASAGVNCLLSSNFQASDSGVTFFAPYTNWDYLQITVRSHDARSEDSSGNATQDTIVLRRDPRYIPAWQPPVTVYSAPDKYPYSSFQPDWALYGQGHWVWINGTRYFVPFTYLIADELEWTPYRHGYWAWEQNPDQWGEYGWTWVSYDPWGWVTDHYGVWRYHRDYGWVWLPFAGTAFRYHHHTATWYNDGDYVGWYPYYSGTDFPDAYNDHEEVGFQDGYWHENAGDTHPMCVAHLQDAHNFNPGYSVVHHEDVMNVNVFDKVVNRTTIVSTNVTVVVTIQNSVTNGTFGPHPGGHGGSGGDPVSSHDFLDPHRVAPVCTSTDVTSSGGATIRRPIAADPAKPLPQTPAVYVQVTVTVQTAAANPKARPMPIGTVQRASEANPNQTPSVIAPTTNGKAISSPPVVKLANGTVATVEPKTLAPAKPTSGNPITGSRPVPPAPITHTVAATAAPAKDPSAPPAPPVTAKPSPATPAPVQPPSSHLPTPPKAQPPAKPAGGTQIPTTPIHPVLPPQPKPPVQPAPKISYSTTSESYVVGTKVATLSPQVTGAATSFKVAPALPTGLTLGNNGVISGTPLAAAATASYSITAQNAGGESSNAVPIQITVEAKPAVASPTGLSYTTPDGTYTAGTPIALNRANGTGGPITHYAVSPALPAGLSLNASTGAITGTPSAAQPATNYTVVGTGPAGGAGVSATLKITVTAKPPLQAPKISYPTVATSFTVGKSIATPIAPTNSGGAISSYKDSGSVTLASFGLAVDPHTGVITGTPSKATPSQTFTVTATNATGSSPASMTLKIDAPVTPPSTVSYFSGTDTVTYTVGTPVNAVPAITPAATYSWIISPLQLPQGLHFDMTTGEISGTPTAATLAPLPFSITASNTGGHVTATIKIAVSAPIVGPTTLSYQVAPSYLAGQTIALTAKTNETATAYKVTSGASPTGLTLNGSTGEITGSIATAGTYTFTVTASRTGATQTASEPITIKVTAPAVGPSTLKYSGLADTYAPKQAISLTPTTDHTADTYKVTVGALPAGLTLNGSTGAITGSIATDGTYTFTVTASDSHALPTQKASEPLSITVKTPVPVVVGPSKLTYSGLVAAGYATGQSVSLSATTDHPADTYKLTGTLPVGVTLNASTGAISGTLAASDKGSYPFTVTASNSKAPATEIASAQLTITVKAATPPPPPPPVVVGPSTLTYSGLADTYAPKQAISLTPTTNHFADTYEATDLPSGLILDKSIGTIKGALATAGTYVFTVDASNSKAPAGTKPASELLTIDVKAPAPKPPTPAPAPAPAPAPKPAPAPAPKPAPPAKPSFGYESASGSASGATLISLSPTDPSGADVTYGNTCAPQLPAGLTFASATGQLEGRLQKTTAPNVYHCTVTGKNDGGQTSVNYTITVTK